MLQHVKQPTRFRDGQEPSTLDLEFTNEENVINNISYSTGLCKSDHLVITFQFICYTKKNNNKKKQTKKKNELAFTKLNYFKGNYTKISLVLEAVDWNQILQRLSLSKSWKILADKITTFVESNISVCKANRDIVKKCPYANQQCLVAIKQKRSKWTKHQHCKSDINYNQYKVIRNKTISELRKTKYFHEKDLAVKVKTYSKLLWGYVRSKLKTKSAIWQLVVQDRTVIRENQEKADLPAFFPRRYFCCGSLLLLVLAVRIYTLVQLLC